MEEETPKTKEETTQAYDEGAEDTSLACMQGGGEKDAALTHHDT